MKQVIQNLAIVSLTMLLLCFSGCSSEENIAPYREIQNGYNLKTLSKDEIDLNSKIVAKLKKINSQSVNSTAKNIVVNDLGLIVQTDNATYIENGNYHSYTFSTQQEDYQNIKNILFSLNAEGEYDSFLVEYDYNKNDLKNFNNDNKPGTATITPINLDIKSITSRSNTYYICIYSYILVDTGELYGVGNERYDWVMVAENCNVRYTVIDAEDQIYNDYNKGTSTYTTSGVLNSVGGSGGIATSPKPTIYDDQELIKINLIKKQLNVTAQQNRFIDSNPPAAFAIYDYLTESKFSEESKSFGKWALNYLIQNPTVTIAQFKNWFMGTSEGQDGDYNATYWDNPNLTFPKQDLPTWTAFNAAFPRDSDPLYDTPEKMFNSIGGEVATFYSGPKTNTCAIRLSKALNYSNIKIPKIEGETYKGNDGKYYFKSAYQINLWMRKTFGTNPATNKTPYNANHKQYTKDQAGEHGINLPSLLKGKKGIYSIYSSNFKWASGHADLLNDNATCGNSCHFYDAPIERLDIWILN